MQCVRKHARASRDSAECVRTCAPAPTGEENKLCCCKASKHMRVAGGCAEQKAGVLCSSMQEQAGRVRMVCAPALRCGGRPAAVQASPLEQQEYALK